MSSRLNAPSRQDAKAAFAYEAVGASAPPLVQPCANGLCWIEVQMFDDRDVPLAGEPYWIRLPDGEVREGTLDSNGLVRLDAIPCGLCIVRLPAAGDEAVDVVARSPNDIDWLEIELLDSQGIAVANEPYRIHLPDGGIREGRLDGHGFARVTEVSPGLCRVSFPDRDALDVIQST